MQKMLFKHKNKLKKIQKKQIMIINKKINKSKVQMMNVMHQILKYNNYKNKLNNKKIKSKNKKIKLMNQKKKMNN